MKTKKIAIMFILLGAMTFATSVQAQRQQHQSNVTIEVSQLYSTFNFSYDEAELNEGFSRFFTGNNNDYTGIFTGGYGIGYRFIMEQGLVVNVGAGMRKAGATMVYDAMNYSWDMQYVNGRLGIGYLYRTEMFSPYLNVSGYYAYMLRGFQVINNEHLNIKMAESMYETDYGIIISPGVQIALSDVMSAYIEFTYLYGLQDIDKDEGQLATNLSYGVTVGLSFALTK